MWNLDFPDHLNSDTALDIAFPPEQGSLCAIQNNQAGVKALYKKYDRNTGQPSEELKGLKIGQEALGHLHDAFNKTQNNRPLSYVRHELKKLARKCVYCAISDAVPLDHFLPRSKYKAHTIYIKNLIPCCEACNRKKSDFSSSSPDSQFLHPYLNKLSDTPILVANFACNEQSYSVDFMILGKDSLKSDNIRRAFFQFTELDLRERYTAEVNDFLFNQQATFEIFFRQGSVSLRNFLAESYLKSISNSGLNHWRTALWRALLQSPGFEKHGLKIFKRTTL